MTTRMMHPDNGWTHAYGQGEIESLKALGWVVESERVVKEALAESMRLDPPPVDPPAKRKYTRKAK
jgi:hypothetical protein